jgi:chromosome segregation ATPase
VDKIKSYLIVGAVCFIVGAALVGGLAYRSGTARAGQLGEQLETIGRINRELAGQLVERADYIDGLEQANRELADAIANRQRVIDSAKRELESSRSSIDKIRALLKILKASQLDSRPGSGD